MIIATLGIEQSDIDHLQDLVDKKIDQIIVTRRSNEKIYFTRPDYVNGSSLEIEIIKSIGVSQRINNLEE